MKKKHPLYDAALQAKYLEGKVFFPLPSNKISDHPPSSPNLEKVGCLILAGGEGSRFGFSGPKGCIRLPLKKEKTLFELLFEKVKVKEKKGPLAIMTSPMNHSATLHFLKEHAYFGLNPREIEIFSQEVIEVSDEFGYLVCSQKGEERKAPNGNGEALALLYRLGIWKRWKEAGIESVQVIPIDNPLADPFDPQLLGVHEHFKVELALRCVKRGDVEEKMGIVALEKEKLLICEYSEASANMKKEKEGADLKFFLGNTGLFSVTMDFIERIAAMALPWHLAKKIDPSSREKRVIFKYEKFLFDIFPSARSFQIILSPREEHFAPLKSLKGKEGLKNVTFAIEKSLNSSKKHNEKL